MGRKKKQVLREGISARILVPVLEELKWGEQQFPYLTRSELIQTAIAFYLRELRKARDGDGVLVPAKFLT